MGQQDGSAHKGAYSSDLSSVPRTNVKAEKKQLHKVVLCSPLVFHGIRMAIGISMSAQTSDMHVYTHTHT